MEKVIIRADRGGDKLMVEMENCRRIFYWAGAASISQLAEKGTKKPDDCKFTIPVRNTTIMGVIEIIPCTREAIINIDSVEIWKL